MSCCRNLRRDKVVKKTLALSKSDFIQWSAILIPLLLFWVILALRIPPVITHYFHTYSLLMFLVVGLLFFIAFRQTGKVQIFAALGLTMALFALALSYVWSSGWSDNGIIGGLLPYKDAKNYYFGANLILNGIPVIGAQQATERPLFPAFLSSILFITGDNLKITIAVIAQLMGLGLYLAARQMRNIFAALPAAIFAALLYFYIQPWIGYVMSETFGFALGCLGFAIILQASQRMEKLDLILGLGILLVAVSARAGTFFIFPLLAIWAGWALRGQQRFSLKTTALTLLVIIAGYLLVNTVFSRFLGIPSGASFRNFSYALYGQVRGGTGWNSAIVELGTRDPEIVYQATLEYFLAHPTHVVIGFVNSYRDFFLPGKRGIFPFSSNDSLYQLNYVLWLAALALTFLALVRLARDIRSNTSSLLLACFIGVFLSIPFLPPIDGGARFYAGTASFIFAIPALGFGFSKTIRSESMTETDHRTELTISRIGSFSLLVLTFFIPAAIYVRGHKPAHAIPACPAEQKVFVLETHPGTYIDLVKTGSAKCGYLPDVCFQDFQENNTEKVTDGFYQEIITLTENNIGNVRMIAGFDLVAERFHYYYISHDKLPDGPLPNLISGCATPRLTENQSIFQVESISFK